MRVIKQQPADEAGINIPPLKLRPLPLCSRPIRGSYGSPNAPGPSRPATRQEMGEEAARAVSAEILRTPEATTQTSAGDLFHPGSASTERPRKRKASESRLCSCQPEVAGSEPGPEKACQVLSGARLMACSPVFQVLTPRALTAARDARLHAILPAKVFQHVPPSLAIPSRECAFIRRRRTRRLTRP
ncbi:hypothetical protein SKAU_G00030520 [Synaphobranchus kaupii]|uniref:Uncharacterized protein n=1 Tax=Synaphobranchus kaupii TaxID=118154 RepID=A0A9Q1JG14_SYNKA|nr:hypothetical protein SKAU_G00030520 [Synaphobranchus kaupii]